MKPARSFLPPRVLTHADWAKKIVVGDFTGDGKPDFAVLHWETGGRCVVDGVHYEKGFLVRPFVNTTPSPGADATFAAMPKLEYINDDHRIYDMYPSDIAVGDVNGDGKDDLIVANAHSDRLYVYLSNGDGTFAPPIEVFPTGNDDPSYIVAGNFSGSGHLDLAVLNTRRYLSGFNDQTYELTFAFLFGNGDGTFQAPIKLEEDVLTAPDAADGGLYYTSNTFQMSTLKRRVTIGGAPRDVVSLNGVARWWDGSKIQTEDLRIQSRFRAERGTHALSFFTPGSELARDGGRTVLAPPPADPPPDYYFIRPENGDTANLDRAWLGYTGQPISELFSGQHFLMEDFDKDANLDLVIFSDEIDPAQGGVVVEDAMPQYHGQRMLLLYGTRFDWSPLKLPAPENDLELVMLTGNGGGTWHRGHRAWQAATGDFDGDGYLDIVTLTTSGVLLHTNLGKRSFQFTPPVIQQLAVEQKVYHPPGHHAWYEDSLQILYQSSPERPVIAAMFRPSGAPDGGTVVFMYETDANRGKVLIVDDELLPAGKYDVYVHDGVAISTGSISVEIVTRPVAVSYVKLLAPEKDKDHAVVEVTGWFGTPRDAGKCRFFFEHAATKARTEARVLRREKETEARLALPVTLAPGAYHLVAVHPKRGEAKLAFNVPSYAPVIHEVGWSNNDGTGGSFRPGDVTRGTPLRPGATVDVQASFVYAPDTRKWELLDSAHRVVASGPGHTTIRAFADDNDNGAFTIDAMPDFPPGSLLLRLTTTEGLVSDLVGPIETEGKADPPEPGPGESLWFIRVKHVSGFPCSGYAVPAVEYDHDDPDPRKQGALQKLQGTFLFPDDYTFTQLTKGEFEAGTFCP